MKNSKMIDYSLKIYKILFNLELFTVLGIVLFYNNINQYYYCIKYTGKFFLNLATTVKFTSIKH